MFFSSAVLFVINKLVGAWLATEYMSGIFHCSGGAFLKLAVNRSCDNETLPLSPRFTFTTGNPGCSVQLAARSEERRVGKECRSRWVPCAEKEKKMETT